MTTYCRTAGFVQGMADFDADAFRLSGAEAGAMDPQQRLLLEVAAHALADAGSGQEGSAVGMFLVCTRYAVLVRLARPWCMVIMPF